MKSLSKLFLLLIIPATFVSCGKDAKLKRTLKGEWNITTLDSKPVPSDEVYTYVFGNPGKRGSFNHEYDTKNSAGEVLFRGTDKFQFDFMVEDEVLTINFDDGEIWKYTIEEPSKGKLILIDFETPSLKTEMTEIKD